MRHHPGGHTTVISHRVETGSEPSYFSSHSHTIQSFYKLLTPHLAIIAFYDFIARIWQIRLITLGIIVLHVFLMKTATDNWFYSAHSHLSRTCELFPLPCFFLSLFCVYKIFAQKSNTSLCRPG